MQGIDENSASSALTITGLLTPNSSSTVLANQNASGSALLTLTGGVANTSGGVEVDNASNIAGGVTISRRRSQ